jgi:hypothetical protein
MGPRVRGDDIGPNSCSRHGTQASAAWLTGPHREGENVGGAVPWPLKIEAYSIHRSEELDQVMKHQDALPLPAIALQAIATMGPRDEVPEQASFPWFASTMLACESFEVIRLRLAKLLIGGDDAEREAQLMVSEKVDAAIEAGANWLAGATPASIIDRYREHVAANARRLAAS